MDWIIISAVSETVAAVGIIGSLLYVGLQTHQNTNTLRHVSVRENMSNFQDLYAAQIQSKDVADLIVRGMEDMRPLDAADQARFYGVAIKLLRLFESMFWQRRHGGLDDELWQAYAQQLTDVMSAPGPRQVWKARQHHFHQEFIDFVDSALARGDGQPLYPEVA